jgi:hypothetical protein
MDNMSQLENLFLKNGSNLINYFFGNNPKLSTICCDASELTEVRNKVAIYGYNCVVTTGCF